MSRIVKYSLLLAALIIGVLSGAHTLETLVYRLRQKVEKDAGIPSILVTDAGCYKLVP